MPLAVAVAVAIAVLGVRAGGPDPNRTGISCQRRRCPRRVATVASYGGPVRHRRRRRLVVEAGKVAPRVNNATPDDGEKRADIRDFVLGAGEIVAVGHD